MQNNVSFTEKDRDFLILLDRLSNELGKLPTNKELARASDVSDPAISMRKTKLKSIGYLDPISGRPTDLAIETLNSSRTVSQIHIPLLGAVSAGKRNQDELVVNMSDVTLHNFRGLDLPTVAIPGITNHKNVFSLTVDGISMEDERIFDGDFIFVEPYQNGAFPTDGDLIVVKYLPLSVTNSISDEDFTDISDEEFAGPTLKYFYRQVNNRYRLSVRKNFLNHPYTIETHEVRPLGKVVGMWRTF